LRKGALLHNAKIVLRCCMLKNVVWSCFLANPGQANCCTEKASCGDLPKICCRADRRFRRVPYCYNLCDVTKEARCRDNVRQLTPAAGTLCAMIVSPSSDLSYICGSFFLAAVAVSAFSAKYGSVLASLLPEVSSSAVGRYCSASFLKRALNALAVVESP